MKDIVFSIFFLLTAFVGNSQNTFKIKVYNEESKQALQGASVSIPVLSRGTTTDSAGFAVLKNIPNGMTNLKTN